MALCSKITQVGPTGLDVEFLSPTSLRYVYAPVVVGMVVGVE